MLTLPHMEALGLIGLLGLVSFLCWTSAQLWFRQRALEQVVADLLVQLESPSLAATDMAATTWPEQPGQSPSDHAALAALHANAPGEMVEAALSTSQASEVANQLRQTPLEVLQQMLQATVDLRGPAWSAEDSDETVSFYGWRQEGNGVFPS